MALFIGFVDALPILGSGTVMIPWAIYLSFTGNITLAIALMIVWGAWAVIKQFIEPKMVSKEIGMHPIFTLVGMYTGFRLMGVLGLMIGPIIILIIANVFRELLKKHLFFPQECSKIYTTDNDDELKVDFLLFYTACRPK